MNFKHIFFGLVLTAGAMQSVEAQQIQTLNQYIFNPYSYNPATAGTTTVSNLYLNYRRQWNNMPDAPISGLGTYDMPISGGKAGVGVQLSTEKAGLNSNVGGKLSYAYHLGLNADRTMKLSFGLSGGFFAQQFDFNRANAVDNADSRLVANNSESATAFAADAGVNFNAGRLNVGVALPQLFTTNNLRTNSYIVGQATRAKIMPNTLISARYLIGNKENITVEPIIMARLASGKLEPQFDVAVLASWKQLLFLGAGYRSANVFTNTAGINGTVGVRVGQRATIAYGVETQSFADNYASPLGLTHDILFGYRFGDVSKEDVTDKTKEVFKGIDDKLAKANARIDSLGKADGDRIAALENKPEPVNNTKELEGRVNSLNGRVGQAEGDIKDLKNRPAGGSTVIQQPTTPTGNYTPSVNLGAATKIQTVYFAANSSDLDKKAKSILNEVATQLSSRGGSVVYLNGTASQEGDKGRNMILSLERSAAVLNYLKKRGVTQTILTTSEGEEGSKAATRKDRSVEIYTLGN